jgi:hypothetical protein
MENSLKSVIEMIDRVLAYVKRVINGEIEGNEKIGKYLLDTLSETSDSAGVDKGQLDTLFNSHLQASIHHRALGFSTSSVLTNLPFVIYPGYSHGFLSGKSCTVASGGFDEAGAGFVVVTFNLSVKLMYARVAFGLMTTPYYFFVTIMLFTHPCHAV